jgi:hypothetical protein
MAQYSTFNIFIMPEYIEKRSIPREQLPLEEHAKRALARFEIKPNGTREDISTAVFKEGNRFREMVFNAALEDVARRRAELVSTVDSGQDSDDPARTELNESERRVLAAMVETQYGGALEVLQDGGLWTPEQADVKRPPTMEQLYAYLVQRFTPQQVAHLRTIRDPQLVLAPDVSWRVVADNLKNGSRFTQLYQENPVVNPFLPTEMARCFDTVDASCNLTSRIQGYHPFVADLDPKHFTVTFSDRFDTALGELLTSDKVQKAKLRGPSLQEFILLAHKLLLEGRDLGQALDIRPKFYTPNGRCIAMAQKRPGGSSPVECMAAYIDRTSDSSRDGSQYFINITSVGPQSSEPSSGETMLGLDA